MISLQNPSIPPQAGLVEIDSAIYQISLKLNSNLLWLTQAYGRAYRFIDVKGKKLYFPEIYVANGEYYRVTPDNDKQGMLFFIVGKEENTDFEQHSQNTLYWNVSLIFNVNLKLINLGLANNNVFTQRLIKDVRTILTNQMGGQGFDLKILNVERDFRDIYREFTVSEDEGYMRWPMDAFRVNCRVGVQEDCEISFSPQAAIVQNLSMAEKITVLQSLNFANNEIWGALSPEQIEQIQSQL